LIGSQEPGMFLASYNVVEKKGRRREEEERRN